MINQIAIFLLGALAACLVFATVLLFRHIAKMTNRIKELEETLERKRHTHPTQEVLEDSLFTIKKLLLERKQEDVWLDGVADALAKIIKDPNGKKK